MWRLVRRDEYDRLRIAVEGLRAQVAALTEARDWALARLNEMAVERAYLLRHLTGLPEWPVPEWASPRAAPVGTAEPPSSAPGRPAERRPAETRPDGFAVSFEDLGDSEARAVGVAWDADGNVVYGGEPHAGLL